MRSLGRLLGFGIVVVAGVLLAAPSASAHCVFDLDRERTLPGGTFYGIGRTFNPGERVEIWWMPSKIKLDEFVVSDAEDYEGKPWGSFRRPLRVPASAEVDNYYVVEAHVYPPNRPDGYKLADGIWVDDPGAAPTPEPTPEPSAAPSASGTSDSEQPPPPPPPAGHQPITEPAPVAEPAPQPATAPARALARAPSPVRAPAEAPSGVAEPATRPQTESSYPPFPEPRRERQVAPVLGPQPSSSALGAALAAVARAAPAPAPAATAFILLASFAVAFRRRRAGPAPLRHL